MFKKSILISGFIFLSSISQAKVWTADQTWNESWEEKYSTWIQNEFNEDVFMRGPYAGISTDCADAVYASRIIFSAQNKLPFLISGSVSNDTSRFDHQSSQLDRVRSFINYVGQVTNTQTLPNDTYSVAINRDALRPGVIWLRSSIASENFIVRLFSGASAPTGHTEVVKEVSPSGIVYLMGSTVPSKVRNLLTVTSLVYVPANEKLGFRRWIWPQNRNRPKTEMNQYSTEQYSMGVQQQSNHISYDEGAPSASAGIKNVQNFTKEIQTRLALREETKSEYLGRMAKDLCSMMHLRNEVIFDAIKYKQKIGRCLNSEEYENFSTPSRDKRIKDWLKQLLSSSGGGLLSSAQTRIEKISTYFDTCPNLKLSGEKSLTIQNALMQFAGNRFSSNPNDSEGARWGLESSTTTCGK